MEQDGAWTKQDFTPAELNSQREEQHSESLAQAVPFPKHEVQRLSVGEQNSPVQQSDEEPQAVRLPAEMQLLHDELPLASAQMGHAGPHSACTEHAALQARTVVHAPPEHLPTQHSESDEQETELLGGTQHVPVEPPAAILHASPVEQQLGIVPFAVQDAPFASVQVVLVA